MLIIYHTATADYRKCKSKKTTLNLQKIDFVLSKSNFWSRGQYGFNYKNMANLSWSGRRLPDQLKSKKQMINYLQYLSVLTV